MTIYDFQSLSQTEQADAVWTDIHIAEREEGNYWILLYQIDSFYVELYYSLTDHEICELRPFSCTELLWPYLKKIDISELQLV